MKEIKSFLKSFVYAFKGLVYMVPHERNFRFHITILGFMTYFLVRFDYFVLTRAEAAILVIASALVLSGEMINTAIEKASDAVTCEHNNSVKIAKDSAAGAVLVFAIASVIVGIIILWQPEAFKSLYIHYTTNHIGFVLLIVAVIISAIFIFKFDFNKKEKK